MSATEGRVASLADEIRAVHGLLAGGGDRVPEDGESREVGGRLLDATRRVSDLVDHLRRASSSFTVSLNMTGDEAALLRSLLDMADALDDVSAPARTPTPATAREQT